MIYHISLYLMKSISVFNVLHYVSVRSVLALLTSFTVSIFFGSYFIRTLSIILKSGVREFTPENHKIKNNTPTMGGIVILVSVIFAILIFCNLFDPKVWLILVCMLFFGAIGFIDDFKKIVYKKGILASNKALMQLVSALIVVSLWVYLCSPELIVYLPIFKNSSIALGYACGVFFILWAIFIMIATSNAVNITDGLDGLATGSLVYNFATYAIVAYVTGHLMLSSYLHLPFLATYELSVVCAAFVGALLGFLWYNTYPAQIFMGDVGSLALGAALSLIALMCKQEFILLICGGLFVVETASVILQVFSYKYFKRRIFKMAPLHHHFELLGWPESKITVRFAIISFILCLLSLMTLKMR